MWERVYGCTAEVPGGPHAERMAFLQHRTNVRRIEIPWDLSFCNGVDVWRRSGKWDLRGQGPIKYGMYRIDTGVRFPAENVLVRKKGRSLELQVAKQLPRLEVDRAAGYCASGNSLGGKSDLARRWGRRRTGFKDRKYWEQLQAAKPADTHGIGVPQAMLPEVVQVESCTGFLCIGRWPRFRLRCGTTKAGRLVEFPVAALLP